MKIRIARGSGDGFGVDDISCAAAEHLGFFEKNGLSVDWVDARGGLAAMTAVLDGKADIAYGGFGPIVSLRAQGKPCRIFVSQARALAQALVVRSDIQDLKALRGGIWAVDAIGALSHHMARLVVRAAGIAEGDIRWDPVGPPPLRIAALLEGRADASLIRTEEALVLHQPHGVLATTEAYERSSPDVLFSAAQAMVGASRTLHEDFAAFRDTVRAYVKLPLSDDELRLLWQREHGHRGWAVDGELSRTHWDAQLALYRELNPSAPAVSFDELITTKFLP
jgi:ABC-type nitrate/sulfonate/bicarbonate transport system substrate-binding protein